MGIYEKEFEKFAKLNPHIIEYIKSRRKGLAVKTLVIDVIIAVFTVVCINKYPIATICFGVAAAILIPIIALKPFRLYKKAWIGEIVNIKQMTRAEFESAVSRKMYIRTFIKCYVEGQDGKKHSFVTYARYGAVYKKGDTVMRVPGLDLPVSLTKHDRILCHRCGALLHPENDSCIGGDCGFPVMKYFEDKNEFPLW